MSIKGSGKKGKKKPGFILEPRVLGGHMGNGGIKVREDEGVGRRSSFSWTSRRLWRLRSCMTS